MARDGIVMKICLAVAAAGVAGARPPGVDAAADGDLFDPAHLRGHHQAASLEETEQNLIAAISAPATYTDDETSASDEEFLDADADVVRGAGQSVPRVFLENSRKKKSKHGAKHNSREKPDSDAAQEGPRDAPVRPANSPDPPRNQDRNSTEPEREPEPEAKVVDPDAAVRPAGANGNGKKGKRKGQDQGPCDSCR
eukprot:g15077.t1